MAVLPDIADWHNAYHCYDYNAWRVGEGEGAINFDRPEVGYYVQLPADGQDGGRLFDLGLWEGRRGDKRSISVNTNPDSDMRTSEKTQIINLFNYLETSILTLLRLGGVKPTGPTN